MRYKGSSQKVPFHGESFMRRLLAVLPFIALASLQHLAAQSVFSMRPDDPHAVYLERGSFGASTFWPRILKNCCAISSASF
jgi:hypothetical protein